MLRSLKQMKGFYLVASDGDLGTVDDVYFDDDHWTVRYMVVDTGGWLSGRQVLIMPHAVSRVDFEDRSVHVKLSKQQIEDSPSIDSDKPVSRQHEKSLYDYYGFPYYWGSPFAWGAAGVPGFAGIVTPAGLPVDAASAESARHVESLHEAEEDQQADPHLRSGREVMGYSIHASDGNIGHVEDFLFNEEDWSLQMMEIDTRDWLPGKHVLVPAHSIREVSWDGQRVDIGMTKDEISNSQDADSVNPANLPAGGRPHHFAPPSRF